MIPPRSLPLPSLRSPRIPPSALCSICHIELSPCARYSLLRGEMCSHLLADSTNLATRAVKVQQQLQLVQASISSSDARARRSGLVYQSPQKSHSRPDASRKLQGSPLSSPAIVDEERAALFRNNLLRSCWTPGMKSSDVQRSLDCWEQKLVRSEGRAMGACELTRLAVLADRGDARLRPSRAVDAVRPLAPTVDAWSRYRKVVNSCSHQRH